MANNSTSVPIQEDLEGSSTESNEQTNSITSIQTPPSLQDQYIFIKEIGHGAQAKIYLAFQLSEHQSVVIKQLNIGSVKTWKEYDLFQREAKILESIHIPGVAQFYDAIDCLEDDPPCSYIVQEFIAGASLAQMIKAGHRFKVDDVYDILIQLLKILSQLHGMTPPVIHRDIKPSNIMITPVKMGYKVTLIDFGAVANPQVQSGGSTVAGTFGYMPPEQLMGHPEPASDIYALAAVAVELFTGKSPANLPQKDFRLIFEPEMEQMPPALVSTLRKMLEPTVKDRQTDTKVLIEVFEQFKANNFSISSFQKEDLDRSREFNRKLNDVESIGESGNLDIWQELSDNTPRDVPDSIMHYYIDAAVKANLNNNYAEKKAGNLVFILPLIILIAFILPYTIITIPVVLVLAVVLGIRMSSNTNNAYVERLQSRLDNVGKECDVDTEKLYQLINKGRKTIAKITSIEYMPLQDNKVIRKEGLIICGVPCFKIKYKFNPPDDSKEEDLVHEYIAHSAPECHYQVGDPLPILYQIENDFFGENVLSMPFPFPMADSNLDEIVSVSHPNPVKKINTDVVEERYEYITHLKPIIKSIENRNTEELFNNIKEHAWLIGFPDDQRCLDILLSLGNQILTSKNSDIIEVFADALVRGMYYRDEVTRKKISDYLLWHLAWHSDDNDCTDIQCILRGMLKCDVCNYSEALANSIMKLYNSPDTSMAVKSVIGQYIRIPSRYMSTYMKGATFEDIIPKMFANWKYRLYEQKDKDAYFEALQCVFDSPHPSKVYLGAFEAAWDCVGFWDTLPEKYKKVFVDGYRVMDKVDQDRITLNARDELGI